MNQRTACIGSFPPLKKHPPSPRGDQCEQSAPTVPLQHNHGYGFETLKRRLGFTAVPCQATANLAVDIMVRVWVRTQQNRVYFDSPVSAGIRPTPALHFQRACTREEIYKREERSLI